MVSDVSDTIREPTPTTPKAAILTLLCGLLVAGACGSHNQPIAPTAAAGDFRGQFNQLWSTFDRVYPYFDYKRIDWNALKAEFEPRAAAATSENELITILQSMLARLHDQHVVLTAAGSTVRTYVPIDFINWNADVWRQYLARANATTRGAAVSAVINGVAYIGVASWNPGQLNVADLDAFLDAFRDRPALIVDVRMNPGGDDSLAFQFAGRFATATTTLGYVQFRSGPGHSEFTPLQPRTFSPRGPFQFTRSVLLLVGRQCASSNESFIAAMRELRHVTLAGDRTAGSTANPQTFMLGGGWSYSVSRWIEYTANMQVIEDQGIAPSLVVPASPADFQNGRDPVLDWAIDQFVQERG